MSSQEYDAYALAKVVALIKQNTENNSATDIYAVASEIHKDLPSLSYAEVVKLIETTVIEVGGSVAWVKKDKRN